MAEALGVTVSAEVARRTTEGSGAVAEAQMQTARARVARGQAAWPAADRAPAPESAVRAARECGARGQRVRCARPESAVRAVAGDGVYVHRADGWHEMKVATVAPRGPRVAVDADTGRERLAWGWRGGQRATRRASRRRRRSVLEPGARGGMPARSGHPCGADGGRHRRRGRVDLALRPCLPRPARCRPRGDQRPRPRLRVPLGGRQRRWAVGNAVFGVETAAAAAWAAWVEPLKTRLYAEGAAPLHAPLHAALVARTRTLARAAAPAGAEEEARAPAAVVRRAIEYGASTAARLHYPAFVARQWPIGSGAVERGCKRVVQARTTGAGMRWSGAGAQQVVALRALHRSGRWDAFWQAQPQRARLLLCPRARQVQRRRPPSPSPRTAPVPAAVVPAPLPPAAPPPRLLRPATGHPWRRWPIGRGRSA